MSNTPTLIIDDENNTKSLKRLRQYFEICKRNINCEKKKKYEVNEKMLETDLNIVFGGKNCLSGFKNCLLVSEILFLVEKSYYLVPE